MTLKVRHRRLKAGIPPPEGSGDFRKLAGTEEDKNNHEDGDELTASKGSEKSDWKKWWHGLERRRASASQRPERDLWINDKFRATVEPPMLFPMPRTGGTLFAVTDGLNAGRVDTESDELGPHRLSSTLAESHVVGRRAPFVAMSLDHEGVSGVPLEVISNLLDLGKFWRIHFGAVELESDRFEQNIT